MAHNGDQCPASVLVVKETRSEQHSKLGKSSGQCQVNATHISLGRVLGQMPELSGKTPQTQSPPSWTVWASGNSSQILLVTPNQSQFPSDGKNPITPIHWRLSSQTQL